MVEHRVKQYVMLTIVLACLQFLLILCIPYVNIEGAMLQKNLAYILAALFWISIIIQLVMVRKSSRERRKLERRRYRGKEVVESLPGIFSFFKNGEAIITDVVLFGSVLLLGIVIWMQVKTDWIIIGVISILFLSFNLHCILNGRNYRCLKETKNNIKEQEQDE